MISNLECISAHLIFPAPEGARCLLMRRSKKYLQGTWQMVTGGIEKGEKAWKAALREIFEETGVIPDRFYSADAVETFYMRDRDKMMFVPTFVGFCLQQPEITLSKEHDAFGWFSLDEAYEKLIWSEQRRILRHIEENFIQKSPHELNLIPLDE